MICGGQIFTEDQEGNGINLLPGLSQLE